MKPLQKVAVINALYFRLESYNNMMTDLFYKIIQYVKYKFIFISL